MLESVIPERRITLVRHGETEGESSIRFHGATDVPLSDLGRAQAERVRDHVEGSAFDLVVSSSLMRAEESARIIAPGMEIRTESGFREIDFGRWEGRTLEEIEALDPELFEEWQARTWRFDFPEGERRSDFRVRVLATLDGVLASNAAALMIVAHKGVVRTIIEQLSGRPPDQPHPELGGVHELTHAAEPDSGWTTRRLL